MGAFSFDPSRFLPASSGEIRESSHDDAQLREFLRSEHAVLNQQFVAFAREQVESESQGHRGWRDWENKRVAFTLAERSRAKRFRLEQLTETKELAVFASEPVIGPFGGSQCTTFVDPKRLQTLVAVANHRKAIAAQDPCFERMTAGSGTVTTIYDKWLDRVTHGGTRSHPDSLRFQLAFERQSRVTAPSAVDLTVVEQVMFTPYAFDRAVLHAEEAASEVKAARAGGTAIVTSLPNKSVIVRDALRAIGDEIEVKNQKGGWGCAKWGHRILGLRDLNVHQNPLQLVFSIVTLEVPNFLKPGMALPKRPEGAPQSAFSVSATVRPVLTEHGILDVADVSVGSPKVDRLPFGVLNQLGRPMAQWFPD